MIWLMPVCLSLIECQLGIAGDEWQMSMVWFTGGAAASTLIQLHPFHKPTFWGWSIIGCLTSYRILLLWLLLLVILTISIITITIIITISIAITITITIAITITITIIIIIIIYSTIPIPLNRYCIVKVRDTRAKAVQAVAASMDI